MKTVVKQSFLSVRVPLEIKKQLRERARKEFRTVSDVVIELIVKGMQSWKK